MLTVTINPSFSTAQQQAGFQHLTSANAFVANLRIDAGKDSVALPIVTVMYIEAANSDSGGFAEEFFIPGLMLSGGPDSHLAVVMQ